VPQTSSISEVEVDTGKLKRQKSPAAAE
jgi:hypothetical protein